MWGQTVHVPHKLEIINRDTWWCCSHLAMLVFQVKLLLTWTKVRITSYTQVEGKALVPCQGHWTDMLLRQYHHLQTNRLWAVLLLTIDGLPGERKSWNRNFDILRSQLTILLVTTSSCFFCEARRNILIKMTILRTRRKITILDRSHIHHKRKWAQLNLDAKLKAI